MDKTEIYAVDSYPVDNMIGAIFSMIALASYITGMRLPDIQQIAFVVSIAAGLFSIANVIHGWRQTKKKNEDKSEK